MSLKHISSTTPVIADSETMATLKLAEEISTFFEDQKLKAQDRIRHCEAFINNLHLPSKSVKEGLASLRQNAEEDYSTLLHLERVLNMRDGGDFTPTLDTPIIPHQHSLLRPGGRASTFSFPSTTTASGFKQLLVSQAGNNLNVENVPIAGRPIKNARLSSGKRSSSCEDDDDSDGHGLGSGFTMGGGGKSNEKPVGDPSDGQNTRHTGRSNSVEDENFDPLAVDDINSTSAINTTSSPRHIIGRRDSKEAANRRSLKDSKDQLAGYGGLEGDTKENENEPCEEEDAEADDFVEQDIPQGRTISGRGNVHKSPQSMARSLPVSVPMPLNFSKPFELPSDDGEGEDEESEDDYDNGASRTSKLGNGIRRRPNDIPKKIAQIAKSMYEKDGYGFGESPQIH